MNLIYRLCAYQQKPAAAARSFFYRNRRLLSLRTEDVYSFDEFKKNMSLIEALALYGPLEISDLSDTAEKETLEEWNIKYPKDPKFYQMILSQMKMWKGFEGMSLEVFTQSEEAKAWLKDRKKIKRKACFELDTAYKKTKHTALQNDLKLRSLLRKTPLLRFEDLRRLGIRNVQSSLERFPFLRQHREVYLQNLKDSLKL